MPSTNFGVLAAPTGSAPPDFSAIKYKPPTPAPSAAPAGKTLTEQQLKDNIDALVKQNAPRETVQGYIDSLKKNPDGTYAPKPQEAAPEPMKPWDPQYSNIGMLGNALLGDPNDPTKQGPIRSAVRPILNLPSAAGRALEDVAKTPFAAAELAADQGPGALGTAALEAGKMAVSPFYNLGQSILGATSEGIDKLTGHQTDMSSPEVQSFEGMKNAITHPLDTATNVASGIYKTSQERPMDIPLMLEGGAAGFNKIAGRDVIPSPVTSIARPVTKGVELATAPLKNAAIAKRATEFEKTLNMSKSLSAGELRYGKDSPQFAAQLEGEGVKFNFGRDERGRLDTQDAQHAVSEVAKRDNATFDDLLKSSNEYTTLDDAAELWKSAARDEFKGSSQQQALDYIDKEIEAYKKQYADKGVVTTGGKLNLPVDVINEIKKDLWSKSKFNAFADQTETTRARVSYMGGHEIKEAIEEAVGGDNIVGRMNKRLGDIAQLQKVLERSQGGAIHGGYMGRMFARVVGGIAGSGGGPGGTIVGAITGDMIADALSNPNRPFSWAKKVIDRAKAEDPALLHEVEKRIKKNADDILARPRLQPPSTIQLGAQAPSESSVTSVPAKKFSYQEPKSGKFARGYYSSADAPKYPEKPPVEDVPQTMFGQMPQSTPQIAPETPTEPSTMQKIRTALQDQRGFVRIRPEGKKPKKTTPPKSEVPAPESSKDSNTIGVNDRVRITEKSTGRSQEVLIRGIKPNGYTVYPADHVGIPNLATNDKFDFAVVKKGDNNAPPPRMGGMTFRELAMQEGEIPKEEFKDAEALDKYNELRKDVEYKKLQAYDEAMHKQLKFAQSQEGGKMTIYDVIGADMVAKNPNLLETKNVYDTVPTEELFKNPPPEEGATMFGHDGKEFMLPVKKFKTQAEADQYYKDQKKKK